MDRIPLFPLGGVLLPGCRLPLRIFERRYLALLADLLVLPADQRRFGVVCIRRGYEVGAGQAGELHDVGCEALLEELTPDSPAGPPVFGVVLAGQRPFRLLRVIPDGGTPYEMAEVVWLEDEPGSARAAGPGEAELRAAHTAYLGALGAAPVVLSADSALLAYDAADRSLLEPHHRQAVLEERDIAARNALLTRMLRRETGLTTRFHAVPQQRAPGGTSFN